MRRITLLVALVASLIAAGHSAAIAGKPGGGGSTGGCVRVTPQVNIANMQVARNEKGGAALVALTVDSRIPGDVLAAIVSEVGAEVRVVDLAE